LESIVRMFEADIKAIAGLEPAAGVAFLDRLDKVRSRAEDLDTASEIPSTTCGAAKHKSQTNP